MKKALIISFLFGVFIAPYTISPLFYYSMGALGAEKVAIFLSQPGLYASFLFYQEQPTRFAMPVDEKGEPLPLERLSEEAKKYAADHPTTPQSTPLSEVVKVVTNGIYYALIFWLVYALVRKLRAKKPVQV